MDSIRRSLTPCVLWVVAVAAAWSCADDHGVASTAEDDYTLVLQVADPTIQAGDRIPLIIKIARTDNSNLQRGMVGVVTLTASVHGALDAPNVGFRVEDDSTAELLVHTVFTAKQSGVAEVRASFLDATARLRILISEEVF